MDVALVLKIVGVGLLVSVSCQILNKSGREEQAALVTVAGIVIVLFLLIGQIDSLLRTVRSAFGI